MKRSLTIIEETITGFTLAEVLITLTVIGVIAALTIPALLQNIQDAQYKTAFKRFYSDFNQATTKLVSDNGGSIKNLCATSDCLRDLYKPYLSYVKSCNEGQGSGNCWEASFWALDGSTPSIGINSGLILSNGFLLNFYNASQTCTDSTYGITRCGSIRVDVNGFNGPNKLGKDIFNIWVLENGVKPFGIQGDNFSTNGCQGSTGTWSGMGCPAQYLMQ